VTGQYATKVNGLVDRYAGEVQASYAAGVHSAYSVGEWGLAAAELASALVAEGVAVAPEDKVLFQELLGKIELSPDTPADIADQLIVE
jgi:hypothetical protein